MAIDQASYMRRRAAEEDNAIRAAICDVARQRHIELAALYRQRIGESAAPSVVSEKQITQELVQLVPY